MNEADPGEQSTLFPKTAGERLREAREAQGLSLAEIAARTRVPARQLEAIEASNYAALPSITYSVGFARAYARAVGADEVAIAREVRAQNDQGVRRTDYQAYEIKDPARVPSRGIALAGLGIAVLLLIAVGLWYGTTLFRGGGEDAPAPAPTETAIAAAPEETPASSAVAGAGQVSLVANDEVWLRVYDASGKTLFENTLKAGDHYDVPAGADGPMINVGRPDKLQVTLNGSALPPLGDGHVAIKDVGISAAALAARSADAPAPRATSTPRSSAPRASATRSPGATPTRRPRPGHADAATPAAAATGDSPPAAQPSAPPSTPASSPGKTPAP